MMFPMTYWYWQLVVIIPAWCVAYRRRGEVTRNRTGSIFKIPLRTSCRLSLLAVGYSSYIFWLYILDIGFGYWLLVCFLYAMPKQKASCQLPVGLRWMVNIRKPQWTTRRQLGRENNHLQMAESQNVQYETCDPNPESESDGSCKSNNKKQKSWNPKATNWNLPKQPSATPVLRFQAEFHAHCPVFALALHPHVYGLVDVGGHKRSQGAQVIVVIPVHGTELDDLVVELGWNELKWVFLFIRLDGKFHL